MKDKTKIIIKCLLAIIILTFICVNNNCYATLQQTETTDGGGGIVGTPKILNVEKYNTTIGNDPIAMSAANNIIGIIRTVGTIISVGALILMGIGYMVNGVEGKAEYKKTMIPYFVGCILLFAGSQIVQIIYDIAKKM